MTTLPSVTANGFDSAVLEADRTVLVDFYTDTCVPCRKLEPMLQQLVRRLNGKITVVRVDAEADSDIAARFDVRGVPSLLLFREGELVDRKTGFMVLPELITWMEEHET